MDECSEQTEGQEVDTAEKAAEEYIGFKSNCSNIRGTIEVVKVCTLELKTHFQFTTKENYVGQHREMAANIQLAYRHLEDARMRLGKAIQAFDGGKSCYPG